MFRDNSIGKGSDTEKSYKNDITKRIDREKRRRIHE
jgi:hypothetical protein